MLVIKAGNGITGENVATIVQAMLIEAEYDDLEQKLTLQQGMYSTYYLLGDLTHGFTFSRPSPRR